MPNDANEKWLEEDSFKLRFSIWLNQLNERRDVFLGYCSRANALSDSIHLYLTTKLDLSVMNWSMDFTAGRSILDEIEKAAARCTCGIFLFTKDDELIDGTETLAAPRDNVIFEAGYFINAKGLERVLIIRENGAKMPADLGGNIYVNLPSQKDSTSIHTQIRDFIERSI